ncbi:MAG: hypothetical protein A2Y40_04410 [Candidatus Margulisbacteria bacterium GWF2_35_9]|nr:MAG: hypothetical protein A2Y40_04410 [Candidatus Margulisbacteria bacterium GWF2_35_9]
MRINLDQVLIYPNNYFTQAYRFQVDSENIINIQSNQDIAAIYKIMDAKYLSGIAIRLINQEVNVFNIDETYKHSQFIENKLMECSSAFNSLLVVVPFPRIDGFRSDIMNRTNMVYTDIKKLNKSIVAYNSVFDTNAKIHDQVKRLSSDIAKQEISIKMLKKELREIKEESTQAINAITKILESEMRYQDKAGIIQEMESILNDLIALVKRINKLTHSDSNGQTAIA